MHQDGLACLKTTAALHGGQGSQIVQWQCSALPVVQGLGESERHLLHRGDPLRVRTECQRHDPVAHVELAARGSLDHIPGSLPPKGERKLLAHLVFPARHQQIGKRHPGGADLHHQLTLRLRYVGQHNSLRARFLDHLYSPHRYLHRSIKMRCRQSIRTVSR